MSFRGFKSVEHFAYECINGADTGKDPEYTLNGLGLSYLPSNIGWLAHLTLLDLSNNHLSTLPIELRYLTKLEEFHL